MTNAEAQKLVELFGRRRGFSDGNTDGTSQETIAIYALASALREVFADVEVDTVLAVRQYMSGFSRGRKLLARTHEENAETADREHNGRL